MTLKILIDNKVSMSKLDLMLSQVNPGWHPLVEKLVKDLVSLGWNGNYTQIKQKFGELRFYIDNEGYSKISFERIMDCIVDAEIQSGFICEMCGGLGEIKSDLPWVMTLCDGHYADEKTILEANRNRREEK